MLMWCLKIFFINKKWISIFITYRNKLLIYIFTTKIGFSIVFFCNSKCALYILKYWRLIEFSYIFLYLMAAFAPSYLHLWLVSNHLSISTYIELDGYETKQSYIIYEFVRVWIFFSFFNFRMFGFWQKNL